MPLAESQIKNVATSALGWRLARPGAAPLPRGPVALKKYGPRLRGAGYAPSGASSTPGATRSTQCACSSLQLAE